MNEVGQGFDRDEPEGDGLAAGDGLLALGESVEDAEESHLALDPVIGFPGRLLTGDWAEEDIRAIGAGEGQVEDVAAVWAIVSTVGVEDDGGDRGLHEQSLPRQNGRVGFAADLKREAAWEKMEKLNPGLEKVFFENKV